MQAKCIVETLKMEQVNSIWRHNLGVDGDGTFQVR